MSGLIAWIEVQIDTQGGCDIWRPIAERNWLDSEVTAAKEALKEVCGEELLKLVPDFKTNRQGVNKKNKEIEDIMKAIIAFLKRGYKNKRCEFVFRQQALCSVEMELPAKQALFHSVLI